MLHSTFRQFEIFVLVVEEEGFARAAERLNISQPAVSSHISALESQIGYRLFERRRGTTPILTAEGQQLYRKAKEVLSQADEIARSLARSSGQPRQREIKIGTWSYLLDRWVRPNLPGFLPKNPYLTSNFITGSNSELETLTHEGKLDVSFLVGYPPRANTNFEWLRDEPIGLFISSKLIPKGATSNDLRQFAKYPFIMPPNSDRLDNVIRTAFSDAGQDEIRFEFRTTYSDVAKSMTLAGVGISCLFEERVEREVAAGDLVKLSMNLPNMSVYLVFGPRRRADSDVDRFASFVRTAVAA
jgi:DNA-binding transcriptional LysR family regulator